jgi:hypothetical protein
MMPNDPKKALWWRPREDCPPGHRRYLGRVEAKVGVSECVYIHIT